jgi:hypothetical protein
LRCGTYSAVLNIDEKDAFFEEDLGKRNVYGEFFKIEWCKICPKADLLYSNDFYRKIMGPGKCVCRDLLKQNCFSYVRLYL